MLTFKACIGLAPEVSFGNVLVLHTVRIFFLMDFIYFILISSALSGFISFVKHLVTRYLLLSCLSFVCRSASASAGRRGVRRLHVELEGERLPDSAGAIISGHEQPIHQGKKKVCFQVQLFLLF